VEDTPLTLWIPGTQWEGLTGTLARSAVEVPVRALSFHLQDPRIVFMPVSSAEARRLGARSIASQTVRSNSRRRAGRRERRLLRECKFEIDLGAPAYVKLDRNVVKGLFGKFIPRAVIWYSAKLENCSASWRTAPMPANPELRRHRHSQFRPGRSRAKNGDTLAALYSVVRQKPVKLQ